MTRCTNFIADNLIPTLTFGVHTSCVIRALHEDSVVQGAELTRLVHLQSKDEIVYSKIQEM